MRYVAFVGNEIIEKLLYNELTMYPVVKCVTNVDGRYPVSPIDLQKYLLCNKDMLKYSVVEFNSDRLNPDMFRYEDVVSVNKCLYPGCYSPIITKNAVRLFYRITDIQKGVDGWNFPMEGLSLARNKECMSNKAYVRMLSKVSLQYGRVYTLILERFYSDMIVTSDVMKKWGL